MIKTCVPRDSSDNDLVISDVSFSKELPVGRRRRVIVPSQTCSVGGSETCEARVFEMCLSDDSQSVNSVDDKTYTMDKKSGDDIDVSDFSVTKELSIGNRTSIKPSKRQCASKRKRLPSDESLQLCDGEHSMILVYPFDEYQDVTNLFLIKCLCISKKIDSKYFPFQEKSRSNKDISIDILSHFQPRTHLLNTNENI